MTTPAISPPATPTRRVLCIDGGGIMGTLPASFLASLEEDLDRPVGQYFDLIAGTSTGGILAIGLALGIPARDLLDLMFAVGRIFSGNPVVRWRTWLAARGVTSSTFSHQSMTPAYSGQNWCPFLEPSASARQRRGC